MRPKMYCIYGPAHKAPYPPSRHTTTQHPTPNTQHSTPPLSVTNQYHLLPFRRSRLLAMFFSEHLNFLRKFFMPLPKHAPKTKKKTKLLVSAQLKPPSHSQSSNSTQKQSSTVGVQPEYVGRTILARRLAPGVGCVVGGAGEPVAGLKGEEVGVGVVDQREARGLVAAAAAAAPRAQPEHGDGARVGHPVQLGQPLAEVGPREDWVCRVE